jgi:hypothetical protein
MRNALGALIALSLASCANLHPTMHGWQYTQPDGSICTYNGMTTCGPSTVQVEREKAEIAAQDAPPADRIRQPQIAINDKDAQARQNAEIDREAPPPPPREEIKRAAPNVEAQARARLLRGAKTFAHTDGPNGTTLLTHAPCMLPSLDPKEKRWELAVLISGRGGNGTLGCWAVRTDGPKGIARPTLYFVPAILRDNGKWWMLNNQMMYGDPDLVYKGDPRPERAFE